MNELTKLLLKLLLGCLFMLSAYFISRPFSSFECNHNRKFLNDTIDGIVVEKEKNSFYGNSERILTKNKNGIFSWEERFYEARDKGFYDEISVGDSIVKKEDELILQIFKANSDSIITVDLSFPCDSDD